MLFWLFLVLHSHKPLILKYKNWVMEIKWQMNKPTWGLVWNDCIFHLSQNPRGVLHLSWFFITQFLIFQVEVRDLWGIVSFGLCFFSLSEFCPRYSFVISGNPFGVESWTCDFVSSFLFVWNVLSFKRWGTDFFKRWF